MADEVRGNGRIDTGTKTEASDGKTCDQPGALWVPAGTGGNGDTINQANARAAQESKAYVQHDQRVGLAGDQKARWRG